MILSILATVAVLAAIATIAAALLLAETTLVYFALGLGGISVLLLLAALIQGGIRAAGQDRTRTGTDGLGKSSVPAVASTAATPPGAHHGPEDSGRVPAPAHGPVRDSVVSEHGSTGFTPVTGDWPETATGSPDPDPARPHGHRPAEDTRPAPEPERFDYRIPHQGRTEDHTWAAAEPGTEGTEPFSDWTPARPDEPNAADEAGLPTPADDAPAEADSFTAFDADVPSDVAEPVAADAAEQSDSPDRADVPDDNADEAPRFNYRVPTADAADDVEAYPDDTDTGSHDAHDDAPTGSAVVEPDSGIAEVDADQAQDGTEPGEPTAARDTVETTESGESAEVWDAVESTEAGADADGGAFSYRVPIAEPFEAEVDPGTSEPAETAGTVEPVEASGPVKTFEPTDAVGTVGFDADQAQDGTEPGERAEVRDTVETTESGESAEVWGAVESTEAGADADGGAFSYRVPIAEPVESEVGAEPAETVGTVEASEVAEATGSEGDAGEGGFSYTVPTSEPVEADGDTGAMETDAERTEDADETAAFSYRVPDTGTDGAAEPHGEGAEAFSYRVPVADTDDDSPVAYAAILDPDDEPSSPDDSSRRQDPDQVS
ncbi:hypothetical protein ACFXKD_06885 [Nocardiopsis aegyptia]|uniref:hypothetical protein n=1 Tax=Nocardiopsis aegyptia TaxID=220378 RepID=UPI00366B72C1